MAGVFLIFLVCGAGVATMILAFAYGSRKALGARKAGASEIGARRDTRLRRRPAAGGVVILTGVDKMIESRLLDAMPLWLIQLAKRF